MAPRDNLLELKKFLGFFTSVYGILAAFSSLFPLSNALFEALPIHSGQKALASVLSIIGSLFMIYLMFALRHRLSRERSLSFWVALVLMFLVGICVLLGYYYMHLQWGTNTLLPTPIQSVSLLISYSSGFWLLTCAFALLSASEYTSETLHAVARVVKKDEMPLAKGQLPVSLLKIPGVHPIQTIVGPWSSIAGPGVRDLTREPGVLEVDILVAYNVDQVLRDNPPFRSNPKAKLRVCLSNMADQELLNVYLRKYSNYPPSKVLEDFKLSIATVLNDPNCTIEIAAGRVSVRDMKQSDAASVELYVTKQRIATSYYRVDGGSWIIPLDAKTARDPSPMCWWASKDSAPEVYERYKLEYEQVIKEAQRVFPPE